MAVGLIKFYQKFISPFLPFCCRFHPTCSEYTKQAIIKYGFIKGGLKGVNRICRCQPFSKSSGYDPLI